MKDGCVAAIEDLGRARKLAESKGVKVEVREFGIGGRRTSLHIFFNGRGSERLLDYWPGTGKVRWPSGEETTVETLMEACKLALGHPKVYEKEKTGRELAKEEVFAAIEFRKSLTQNGEYDGPVVEAFMAGIEWERKRVNGT
jgi:hypothetical protein